MALVPVPQTLRLTVHYRQIGGLHTATVPQLGDCWVHADNVPDLTVNLRHAMEERSGRRIPMFVLYTRPEGATVEFTFG